MILTFVLVSGFAIAILTVSVVATRTYGAADAVLIGETTAVGLADPGAETLTGHNTSRYRTENDWQIATLTKLSDAEDLLDYLEAQGYSSREFIVMGNSSFAVRWR
jgi:hypothetical protein